jgi:hypothetical protein
MSYAADTSVSVEKTKGEIEGLLMRKGADRFMSMTDKTKAGIAFELNGKQIRFILPLPDKNDKIFWETPTGRTRRSGADDSAYRAWEQACRSRWCGLFLNIKAKLEAVEIGITTFEAEFLAHFVLPSGNTVGDEMLPRLDEVTSKPGTKLLLGF